MNKKWITVVSIVSVLVFFFAWQAIEEKKALNKTVSFLTEEYNYQKEDIITIKSTYTLTNLFLGYNPYTIKVVFEDEPDAMFYFSYDEKREIIPSGQSGKTKNNDKDLRFEE